MGHGYLVAAFCCAWTIQLGYVMLLVGKWLSQRQRLKTGR